jgi:hypothetical protein
MLAETEVTFLMGSQEHSKTLKTAFCTDQRKLTQRLVKRKKWKKKSLRKAKKSHGTDTSKMIKYSRQAASSLKETIVS